MILIAAAAKATAAEGCTLRADDVEIHSHLITSRYMKISAIAAHEQAGGSEQEIPPKMVSKTDATHKSTTGAPSQAR